MDNPTIFLPSTPRFLAKGHTRAASRSPTRPRLMDDMLADLSPATTLEAFTSASGTLKASIEAASPTQRAFGIRAAIASKNIQEWVNELSAWPWPTSNSEGFETPAAKRRKRPMGIFDDYQTEEAQGIGHKGRLSDEVEYWGCLPAANVRRYESRIEEISEDMEDLNVEEIKTQVLDRHVLPRSRASSLSGPFMEASTSQPYTKMDDFTAIVTATVLQALPSLSRLMALLGLWTVRLSVLREVPHLLASMEDAEVALKSGWKAIDTLEPKLEEEDALSKSSTLSRQDYKIMRDVLQEKVSKLGQKLDQMLDALEGRNDTLPERWLDSMESIEQDYGEWVVCGERRVREDEWVEEKAARQLEQLRRRSSSAVDHPISDLEKGAPTLGLQNRLVTNATTFVGPQTARMVSSEATPFQQSLSPDFTVLDTPTMEVLPRCSEPSSFDGPEVGTIPRQEPKYASDVKRNGLQPTEAVNLTECGPVEAHLLMPELSPPSQGKRNVVPPQVEVVADLSSLSDGVVENTNSLKEVVVADDPPRTATKSSNGTRTVDQNEYKANQAKTKSTVVKPVTQTFLAADDFRESNKGSSCTLETSALWNRSSSPAVLPTETSTREIHPELEIAASPSPRHDPDSTQSLKKPDEIVTIDYPELPRIEKLEISQNEGTGGPTAQKHMSDAVASLPEEFEVSEVSGPVEQATLDLKPTHIDLPSSSPSSTVKRRVADHLSPDIYPLDSTNGHSRETSSASIISGYATSEPSPVIQEAEPTEYFRPVSPPIIAKFPDLSNITTPTRPSFNGAFVPAKASETAHLSEAEIVNAQGSAQLLRISLDSLQGAGPTTDEGESASKAAPSRRRPVSNDSVISVVRGALGQSHNSQEGGVSSDVSTINERLNSAASTPVRFESPGMEAVPRSWYSQFVSNYDGDSPSLGRVSFPNGVNNYSPASSPPETPPPERRPLELRKTPSFDPDSFYNDSPATPGEPPALNYVDLSPTPALISPPKHSDDQLQQQISEILESIPARIRLSSEPDTIQTSGIKPPKKRISLNPFSRPASRAATPSFTLAPAYARNPRPRPQNGNPEIKLYHLSRSTGEAPIKLFVRLVGEQGERVMVRVGGGWADLGEYLKEYASHHGRRSDQPGNVEIQDLPPRVVSTSSTASTSTLRNGTWNTSEASSPVSRPGSRPGSALGRPLSSLAIRKTRKSVGEEAREKAYRSPSTPLPPSFRSSPSGPRANDTPPSANSGRSISQMSWREEDSSLGLAGPRSRKGEISAENAAWVESMKEKVRIASAEKEKKGKASFGEIGQVGATKRLFKRSG